MHHVSVEPRTETMETSTVDLNSILQARTNAIRSERSDIKDVLSILDVRVRSSLERLGKRPSNESSESIVEQMKALEFQHTTTCQTNADERKFLREMEKLRLRKKLNEEYDLAQAVLTALKARRKELLVELQDKENHLNELYDGIRKVRAAEKVGCSIKEVVEKKLVVPDECVPRLIGKAGATLHKLETSCDVNILIDRNSGNVRILGREVCVENGVVAVNKIVDTHTLELPLSEQTIYCLLHTSAALANEIATKHSILIDVSRAKRNCRLVGLRASVEATKDEINAIDAHRAELPIEENMIPVIVGKGGATIRGLEERYNVQLDVLKLNKKIVILGLKPDVLNAFNHIEGLLQENKEVEEILRFPRYVAITAVLGKGGSTVRRLQREFGVSIQIGDKLEVRKMDNNNSNSTSNVEAKEGISSSSPKASQGKERDSPVPGKEAPKGASTNGANSNSSGDAHADRQHLPRNRVDNSRTLVEVRVNGVNHKVLRVCRELERIASVGAANSELITFPDYSIPFIVGKHGSRLKQLREEVPDCDVELYGRTVHVYSSERSRRQVVIDKLHSIADANCVERLPFPSSCCRLLKTARGADCRKRLQARELGLQFEINDVKEEIELKTSKDNVNKAKLILLEFQANNFEKEMTCADQDIRALLTTAPGVEESPIRLFEKRFGVGIQVYDRKRPNNNNKAKTKQAKSSPSSTSSPDSPQKVVAQQHHDEEKEEPHEPVVSSVHARDYSRICVRGQEDAVEAAFTAIQDFLLGNIESGSVVISFVEPVSLAAFIGKAGANLKKFELDRHCRVDVLTFKRQIRIRGKKEDLPAIRKAVRLQMENVITSSTFEVERDDVLPDGTVDDAQCKLNGLMRKAISKFAVDASCQYKGETTNMFRCFLRGPVSDVMSSKRFIIDSLSGETVIRMDLLEKHLESLPSEACDAISLQNHVTIQRLYGEFRGLEISGPIDFAVKARLELTNVLDRLFPCEFMSVAMSERCLLSVGSPRSLIDLSDETGASLTVDHWTSTIHISGPTAAVAAALKITRERVATWQDLHALIEIDQAAVKRLMKASTKSAQRNSAAGSSEAARPSTSNWKELVNSLERLNVHAKLAAGGDSENSGNEAATVAAIIELSGSTKESVRRGSELVNESLLSLKGRFWSTSVPPNLIGGLIGKGGSNLKILMEGAPDVRINVDKKTGSLELEGSVVSHVETVCERIKAFIEEEKERSNEIVLAIPRPSISLIIGPKGASIRDLQEQSGCRVDLDDKNGTATLRGKLDCCKRAMSILDDMLQLEGFSTKLLKSTEPLPSIDGFQTQSDSDEEEENDHHKSLLPGNISSLLSSVFLIPKIPPGASPDMIAKIVEQSLSKSSLRRLRRRQQSSATEPSQPEAVVGREPASATFSSPPRSRPTNISIQTTSSRSLNLKSRAVTRAGDDDDHPRHPSHSPNSINSALSNERNNDEASSASNKDGSSTYHPSSSINHISPFAHLLANATNAKSSITEAETLKSLNQLVSSSVSGPEVSYYKSSSGLSVRL